MRRHLEAPQLQQAEPSAVGVRAEQPVVTKLGPMGVTGDGGERVPQGPADGPGTDHAGTRLVKPVQLGKGYFEFVQRLMPGFINPRRLAGRADEPTREQVGQRWM